MITVTKPDLPPMDDYVSLMKNIWDSKWLTNDGRFLKELVQNLETYLKINNLILVNNGTSALQIALRGLKLKGEVITTPFTFAATTNVLLWDGITPVFCDVYNDTYNINVEQIEEKITKKTSAILAVHVYGNPCNVIELEKISKKYDLKIIYDAAHCFGVEYNNNSILNYGDISTLSLHATKVYHTIEGGALRIKDKQIYENISYMIKHGIKSEEEILSPGVNMRMNEFQAIMGLCNLKYYDEKLTKRDDIYNYYKQNLGDLDNVKFQKIIASKYNYAYMPVCFKNRKTRDVIYNNLLKNNILARKYFYPLVSDLKYIKSNNTIRKIECPVAKKISDSVLCLPLYSELNRLDIDKIINVIKTTLISII